MRAPFQAASSTAAGRRPGSGGRGRARAARGKTSRPRGFAAADWGTPALMFPGCWRAFGRGATRWRSVAAPRPAAAKSRLAAARWPPSGTQKYVYLDSTACVSSSRCADTWHCLAGCASACEVSSCCVIFYFKLLPTRRGGACARTYQSQLDVLKTRCFPDAHCCS